MDGPSFGWFGIQPLTFSPYNRADFNAAAGVIVRDQDCGRAAPDGGLEELAHPHQGGIQRAFVNVLHADHSIPGVQQEHPQVRRVGGCRGTA